MKKHLILSLSMVGAVASTQAMVTTDKNEQLTRGDDAYGQTFFSIRPEFETCSPEYQAGWRDRAKARCDGRAGAFQFVPLGGQSTKSKDLMRYFSPSPVDQLVVDSGALVANPTPPPPALGTVDGSNGRFPARDINPTWFGIGFSAAQTTAPGRYQSILQFRPRRTVGGLGITYRQYFGRDCDCEDMKWYFELSAPILHVRNKIRLEETAVNVTSFTGAPVATLTAGGPQNMIQALSGLFPIFGGNDAVIADGQEGVIATGAAGTMQFGLMRNTGKNNNDLTGVVVDGNNKRRGGYSKTGTDIELKFGRDYYTSECCHFDGYVGLHIPGSSKPKGHFVFEAVPGFNQHFGFMLGGSSGTEIWRNCDRSLSWEASTNVRYWIRNTQTRSFDLKNRPWSRYMLVTDTGAGAANVGLDAATVFPGINLFTQKFRVHPRFSFDTNVALVYNNDCGFNAEVGWNFWARQGERVSLRNLENNVNAVANGNGTAVLPFVAGRYYVTALDESNNLLPEATNIISNIGNNNSGANVPLVAAAADLAAYAINVTDINYLSVAAPAALSNIVYGHLGYNWDDRCHPIFVGLGGSYEISKKNTALNRWLVWGKIGVSI